MEKFLDQRQNAKKDVFIFKRNYCLLEENAEEWSADGTESSADGEENHESKNALSELFEEETIDISSVRLQNQSEIWSCDPLTSSTGRAAAHNVFQENAEPLWFANRQCGSVLHSFLLHMRPSLLETIRN